MVTSLTHSVRESMGELRRRPVVVELAIVLALLLGFQVYVVAVSNVLDPYFLDSDAALSILEGVFALVGLGAIAGSCAYWRGYAVSTALPDRTDARLAGFAVGGAAVFATVPFLLLAVQTGVTLDHVVGVLSRLPGVFSGRRLVRVGVFVPGMVLVYHGLVQGAVRRAFDRDRTRAVAVTTLLGGYLAVPFVPSYGTFTGGPWLSLWGNRAAVAVLGVLALGVAVYADERVADRRVRALALVPAAVALALVALVLATTVDSAGEALAVAARIGLVGVAAYAYDRTASLVTPALVYATYAVVSVVLSAVAFDAFLASVGA